MNTYQLLITIAKNTEIKIGKLGTFEFPEGNYIYTGSAKRNIISRINRHKSKDKKLHWHIDYLLNSTNCEITRVRIFDNCECDINQQVRGEVIINKFGATDCKEGCGSHLKLIPPSRYDLLLKK